MKFSYKLLKKLVPQIKNKEELADKLVMFAFEIDSISGDTIDIKLPPNRYSDAGSHLGMAREISAITGQKLKDISVGQRNKKLETKRNPPFQVEIKDKNLCLRYTAQYFENVKIGASPKWMQEILVDCGLRPINSVVDIMNYVMLETGQPLHAFDFDKIKSANPKLQNPNSKQIQNSKSQIPKIIIRRAGEKEKFETLDGQRFELSKENLVITDESAILALAGIKGGKKAEVDSSTRRIIVESANFDAENIYKTSKDLNLITDASVRFSRNLSPELAILGLRRAKQLLVEITGAKPGAAADAYPKKQAKKLIKFEIEKFSRFVGLSLGSAEVKKYLERLGFIVKTAAGGKKQPAAFLVEVPPERMDINLFEDLAEEAARMYGFDKLPAIAPHARLTASGYEDQIILKDKIRDILASLGFCEVYNYSFVPQKEGKMVFPNRELAELENPISRDFYFLRPSLSAGIIKNIEDNFRFFDQFGVFEIGNYFQKHRGGLLERMSLAAALASKKEDNYFRLKGIIYEFLKKAGLTDFLLAPPDKNEKIWIQELAGEYLEKDSILKIESGGVTFGYFGRVRKNFSGRGGAVLFEMDLETLLRLAEEEHEYRPLPKFPSISRDLSVLAGDEVKISEVMETIETAGGKLVEDVDFVDEFDLRSKGGIEMALNAENPRSLTFRIVFQAEDRTLTDAEADRELKKIIGVLERKFGMQVR